MSAELTGKNAATSRLASWRQKLLQWNLLHSLALGLTLGAILTLAYRFVYDQTNQAILSLQISGESPSGRSDEYDRFRRDLKHYFHGTVNAPYSDGVAVTVPDLFQIEGTPRYVLIEVAAGQRERFGGLIPSPRTYPEMRAKWAVSLTGGPNVCFEQGRPDARTIAGFLGLNGIKILTADDADHVRVIVNHLLHGDQLLATSHLGVSPRRWRIGALRDTVPSQYFELDVAPDGVIQTGAFHD